MAEEVSLSLTTLRESANEVQQEEKSDIEDSMYLAADQIAAEYGLESPLRKNRTDHQQVFIESVKEVEVVRDSAAKPSENTTLPSEVAVIPKVDDVVDVLLSDMKFAPKPDMENNLIDDVDALLKMQQTKEVRMEKAKGREKNQKTTSKITDRYLQRTSSSLDRSRNSLGVSRSGNRSNVDTAPSKIAVLLSIADERDWGENIRRSMTHTEELLFRSMKKINSNSSGRPGSAQAKSTATSRPGSSRGSPNDRRDSKASGDNRRSGGQSVSSSSDGARRKQAYEQMRMSTSRLSAPSQHGPSKLDLLVDPTLRHSTLSDAKECTFRPNISGKNSATKKKGRDDGDGERKEDAKYGFISRQEAEERTRRADLADAIGEAKYEARLDKKACPECGAKQKYDEVKEKRKVCPNCRVEYTVRLNWAKVSNKFFRRGAQYTQKAEERLAALRRELEDEFQSTERKVFDRGTGKVVTVRDSSGRAVLSPEEEHEFFQRLQAEKEARLRRLAALDKELYDDRYPFKPTISSKKRGGEGNDEDDEEDNSDGSDGSSKGFAAFIRRVDEDLEYRRETMPAKYLPVRSKHDKENEPLPFRP